MATNVNNLITMTRRLPFSAAHADWVSSLSAVENEQIFGPTASSEPYGHNYVLDVSVEGKIDPLTGILINIKELDRIVKEKIIAVMDHKFINRQLAIFAVQPVTLENLIKFIADELIPTLPDSVCLNTIRLESMPTRYVTWQNPQGWHQRQSSTDRSNTEQQRNPMGMLSTRVYEFSASHRLHSPHLTNEENRALFGKCNFDNGHGHNYEIEITVTGPIDACSGRVIDPNVLDEIVDREVVDRYDHRHFNYDIPEFEGLVPSAEVITLKIWDRIAPCIPAPARLYRVLVRETARNFFEYYGETPGEDNDVR